MLCVFCNWGLLIAYSKHCLLLLLCDVGIGASIIDSYYYVTTTPNWHEKFISAWEFPEPEDSDNAHRKSLREEDYIIAVVVNTWEKNIERYSLLHLRTRAIFYEGWTEGESAAHWILGLSYRRPNNPNLKNTRFTYLHVTYSNRSWSQSFNPICDMVVSWEIAL